MMGCLGPVKKLYPENENQRPIPAYVVSLGWHVGIALDSEYLVEKLPEHKRLPDTEHLLVGWGDNKYYPAERAGVGLFLRAAFLPTQSVIHVVGFDEEAENYFGESDVVKVQLSKQGMEAMSHFVSEQFKYDDGGDLKFAADGLYPTSNFFEAKGFYFFPKTSNKWAAKVLRKSGFPITPFYAMTSGNVIKQARKSGKVIQQR
jgi:uncharacterized protein (TIGR02117 family)